MHLLQKDELEVVLYMMKKFYFKDVFRIIYFAKLMYFLISSYPPIYARLVQLIVCNIVIYVAHIYSIRGNS